MEPFSSHVTDSTSAAPVCPSRNVKASVSSCRITVRCSPEISDPSEMHTILVSSIRSLFGELESHSFGMEVKALPALDSDNNKSPLDHFTIDCKEDSVDAIRASLTMATTNQFGRKTVYRFDIVEQSLKTMR